MDKGKEGVVEALADLARRAWLGRYAFNEHCDNSLKRFNRFKATASAVKTAVEGPLLEEVERLTVENARLSALDNHHRNWTADIAAELGCGDAARYRADALCCIRGLKRKAEKAEADLKAAQEREARLREDAERWRALVGCARVRLLGTAGIFEPKPDLYAHIGIEAWTKHPAGTLSETVEALTAFADIARATLARTAVKTVEGVEG